MKAFQFFGLLTIGLVLALEGCGSIKVISDPKALDNCNYEECIQCEECKIIPTSGNYRDLRGGFYFDPVEKKCKQISYSSGGIPAPFRTMEECKLCCCCQGYVNVKLSSNNKTTK
jgi:hypothetical protein